MSQVAESGFWRGFGEEGDKEKAPQEVLLSRGYKLSLAERVLNSLPQLVFLFLLRGLLLGCHEVFPP